MSKVLDEVFAVEETNEEVFAVDENNENEPEEDDSKGVYIFKKPINLDGTLVEKVRYDFSQLRPVDFVKIVQNVGKKENVLVPAFNLSVQVNVFCKAAGIPVAVFGREADLRDFNACTALARSFLLDTKESEDDTLL